MNYQCVYNNLIAKRGSVSKPKSYSERHHIVPKCLGGADEENNLIHLSAKAHYIAHLLLAKLYGGKLWSAVYLMGSVKGRFNSRLYTIAKADVISRKKLQVISPAHKKALSDSWSTRVVSQETKDKIGNAHRGRTLSLEHALRIGESNRGKKRSPEVCAKISMINTGRKQSAESIAKTRAGTLGKKRNPEQIERIKEAQKNRSPISEETRKKMSDAKRGRKLSDETKTKMSKAQRKRYGYVDTPLLKEPKWKT